MIIRRIIFAILLSICLPVVIIAQTLGGNSIFNFLRLSNTPRLTALGGVNLSHPAKDLGMSFQNPALLTRDMDQQLHLVFSDLYAGTTAMHLAYGFYHAKWKTSFSSGLQYLDYGKTPSTDAAGNVLGQFRAADMLFQISAARTYQDRWNYGISLKYIASRYGWYRANGVAFDMGVLYKDSSGGFRASMVLKNAGMELKKFSEGSTEELPFELQAGVTQRLKGAPFSFSLTAQQLHRFDIRYYDTAFNQSNAYPNKKANGAGKLIDHLILGTTVHLNERLEFDLGYNFLRRRELNIAGTGNGLNGFSYGMNLKLKKFSFQFARANYQANTAFNQIGLTLNMAQF